MNKSCYVYIITNKHRTVLYTGLTNDLFRRAYEHKHKLVKGFSSRYNLDRLVYFEQDMDPATAIDREKQIKNYSRLRKEQLIRSQNPEWSDLAADWER